MTAVSIGELEVAIDLGEPGDRAAFVELLVDYFGESEYVLSDIETNEQGRVIDLYVEAFTDNGYTDIQRFVIWLKEVVEDLVATGELGDNAGERPPTSGE